MSIYYFDTSALVKIYHRETGTTDSHLTFWHETPMVNAVDRQYNPIAVAKV